MIGFVKNLLCEYSWLTHIAIAFFVCLVISYTQYRFHKKLGRKLVKSEHFIFKAFLDSIYWPLLIFIWLSMIFFSLDTFPILKSTIYLSINKYLIQMRIISDIVLMGWLFMNFIKKVENLLLQGVVKSRLQDPTTIHAVSKFARIVAIMIVLLFAFQAFDMPISGLVAFGGGSAIVVGIAGQQIFANYLGGLIIYSDRHFMVGDWIYSPDKNVEGVIEAINWRTTTIRTPDKCALFVPNSMFSSIITVNMSRMTNWRINEMISLRYQDIDLVESIVNDIKIMIYNHIDIDRTQNFMVSLYKFSEYSLDISVVAYTKTTDRRKYKEVLQDILIKIFMIIRSSGAEIAVPLQISLVKNNKTI